MTRRPKLIEVALPLEAIDRACVREKSIRHGHPSTLHLWWARRPLAAMRAVMWASLVDDPSGDESLSSEQQVAERKRLFRILGELLIWENSSNPEVIRRARVEIERCCRGAPPAILDPFGGGGTTPLEAQRLGLTTLSGDLNPVAVLIQKALVEIPPRFAGRGPVYPDSWQMPGGWDGGRGLAEDVAAYGKWMRARAHEKIGHLYPNAVTLEGEELTPIAWLWVRTIPSPDPAWNGQVPLVKTWELKRRPNKPRVWFEPAIDEESQEVAFRIREGGEPELAPTIKRGNGTCIATGAAMPNDYIVEQFNAGNASEQLVAVVADGGRRRGRVYLEADEVHAGAAKLSSLASKAVKGIVPLRGQYLLPPKYGFNRWSDLFAPRQLAAMVAFSDLLPEVWAKTRQDAIASGMVDDGVRLRDGGSGAVAYADAIVTYLALAVDRLADYCNGLCTWHVSGEKVRDLFARQAIPITWDIAEVNPFSSSSGNWLGAIEWIKKVVAALPARGNSLAIQRDARGWDFGQQGVVVCTDPPYYDNIPYADISDFFYVWLRRNLADIWPDELATLVTPKADEIVANHYRHGGRDAAKNHFEQGMREFLGKLARAHTTEFPISIFYAYRANEGRDGRESGWSTFLQALVDAGLQITATWPMRTELANRSRGLGSNALASSVVLVCRSRKHGAITVNRADFVSELRTRLPEALELLLQSNIAPVDLPQATIGPGMKIFSGYSAVVQADGQNMRASEALTLINRHLEEHFGGIDAELDAPTRFACDWYRLYGFNSGLAGDADSIANARGTSLAGISIAGIGQAIAGKFSLTQRSNLDPDWAPDRDRVPTAWEAVQHLARVLESSQEDTARLYSTLGSLTGAVRDVAFLLFRAADERGDAAEAFAYNSLVSALPVIAEISGRLRSEHEQLQF